MHHTRANRPTREEIAVELSSEDEIDRRLEELPDWRREGDSIVRSYSLDDFVEAVDFTRALVEPAESANHHPDLEVSWGTVVVRLTTHDAGGLTSNDFDLARKYDELYEEAFS